MSVLDDQVNDLRHEADRLRREGQQRLLEADAIDDLCNTMCDLDSRILALSTP